MKSLHEVKRSNTSYHFPIGSLIYGDMLSNITERANDEEDVNQEFNTERNEFNSGSRISS